METIAKRPETLRKQKGLTQKEVAEQMNIPASTYRDWEYGKQIKGEPYVKLAEILEVSLTQLLTGRMETVHSQIMADVKKIERIVESIKKTAASL